MIGYISAADFVAAGHPPIGDHARADKIHRLSRNAASGQRVCRLGSDCIESCSCSDARLKQEDS